MADTWDPHLLLGSYPPAGAASSDPGCSDLDLLALISGGDEHSFNTLYLRYHKAVYNYLLRLMYDQEAAQELLQEVFVGVWQGAGRFQGRAQVRNWIFRIAHNQAVSWLRRHQQTEISLDDAEVFSAGDISTRLSELEEQAGRGGDSLRVAEALARLAPKHRAVLELAFGQEMSYKEIAAVVGCPVGTVKSRMSHAVRQLAAILGPADM